MEQLEMYTHYNLWANGRLCGFLQQLTEEQWHREVVSSFPSIYKTVYHIYGAETVWLQRLNRHSPSDFPKEEMSGNALCNKLLDASEALLKWVQAGEHPDKALDFADMKGNEYAMPVSGIIMHVCNHSTFHRGQLVTLLRNVGYTDLESTDLITYLRTR